MLPDKDIGALINKIGRYVMYGLCALCLVFFVQFYLSISGGGEEAISLGKRISINVESGVVTMRNQGEVVVDPEDEDPDEDPEALPKNFVEENDEYFNVENPPMAVVIQGIGLNRSVANKAMELPQEVALSFSPYMFGVKKAIRRAKKLKHEILLDLPMETAEYPRTDPGPYTILTYADTDKNLFKLKKILALTKEHKEHVALLAIAGEQVTRNVDAIRPIVDDLRREKTVLLYNETPHNIFLADEARSVGLSIIKNYFVVDDVLTEEAIDAKLNEALTRVQLGGERLVVIGRAYPITVSRISIWLRKLKESRIRISRVSDLIIKN